MINLIPPSAKKSLLIEYWVRVSTVWLVLWSSALLCSAVMLWPTHVLIEGQVEAYKSSADQASEKVADYKNVSKALVQSSQQAKAVLDESKTELFSKYIEMFENLQTDNIVLSQISLDRVGVEIGPIRINGVASDRQALASFRDRLLAEEMVESVDLPISSLAKDKDTEFSLSVVLTKQPQI